MCCGRLSAARCFFHLMLTYRILHWSCTRYYSCGPATVVLADPAPLTAKAKGGVSQPASQPAVTAVADASRPHGASWTWLYPWHYAPLMYDLASPRAASYRPSPKRRAALFSPPLVMTRSVWLPSGPAAAHSATPPGSGWIAFTRPHKS